MPATTRTKTNSLPAKIESAVASILPSSTSSRKRTTATANTSKPRAKKVASGRVGKTGGSTATTTTTTATTKRGAGAGTAAAADKKTIHKKKTPAKRVTDKLKGKVEHAEGVVEGKPGKKAAGTRKQSSTTTKRIAAPGTGPTARKRGGVTATAV